MTIVKGEVQVQTFVRLLKASRGKAEVRLSNGEVRTVREGEDFLIIANVDIRGAAGDRGAG